MKKSIASLLTLFSFILLVSANAGAQESAEMENRTFADLSDAQKTEAISHMISTGSCEWNGINLFGKVEFVTSFADIKIEFVTSFPDIRVKFVDSFADDCGEWEEVTSFPDFKVEVVTSFPDLKVQKVDSFPGMD